MSDPENTMRAVKQDEGKEMTASVKSDAPIPSLESNEVLIKVQYAAQNPTDWKHSAFFSPPGATLGCDFAGTIAKLGPDLVNSSLKVGDRVAGCCHGNLFQDKGSFAEYTKQESDLVFVVPESMDMAEASTFGVAWVTACQVLVSDQNVPWPPAKQNKPYLIYGASSSVGLFAIPLAKAMGYTVIAVCSPHSFDLVKSYGADEVVDYHQGAEAAGAEIKRLSGGKGVEIGLDTISEGESIKIAQAGFGERGGRLNLILPAPKDTSGLRKDVELSNTMMYTLFGKRFTMTPMKPNSFHFEVSEKDRKFGADIMSHTPELITKYGIKGNPIDMRGGLETVPQGFADMKAGKVSGKKFVYKVATQSSL